MFVGDTPPPCEDSFIRACAEKVKYSNMLKIVLNYALVSCTIRYQVSFEVHGIYDNDAIARHEDLEGR